MNKRGSHLRSLLAGSLALLGLPSMLGACTALMPPDDDAFVGLVQGCMKDNVHFTDAWGCVQAKYAEGQISEADARSAPFLKLGDDLAQQVEFRKLSDGKARERLLAGLPRGNA